MNHQTIPTPFHIAVAYIEYFVNFEKISVSIMKLL